MDDCMFGSLATTEETWRWRSSYLYEGLDEARLLATLRGPTPEDPFRFLGLKCKAQKGGNSRATLSDATSERRISPSHALSSLR
eukprot:jgi/Phyca11/5551/fgenesh1_pm.PHYCAscaffold_6_\